MDTQRFPGRKDVALQIYQTLTIAAASSLSGSAQVQGFRRFALYVPTITSASVTLYGAMYSGDTFRAILDDAGGAIGIPASTGDKLITSSSMLTAIEGLYGIKVKVGVDGASAANFILSCAG